MPVECHIDHQARLVTITGRVSVALKEIFDCLDVVVVQDAMGYPKLIDTREAVGCFSEDDIMTMGARAQAYAFYDPRGPVAVVASRLESIENMRRFMNLAYGGRPLKLFGSIEPAEAWLHRNCKRR